MSDLIERKAAIDAIKEDKIDLTNPNAVVVFKATGDFEKAETQVMTCDRHIKILKALPSAQPERKEGTWVEEDDAIIHGHCSICGWMSVWQETDVFGMDFCPNCGAKMGGNENADV